jgi:hypothetical protein
MNLRCNLMDCFVIDVYLIATVQYVRKLTKTAYDIHLRTPPEHGVCVGSYHARTATM